MTRKTRQFCTFHVDGLFLGIDVQQVQEVIRYQAMTRIPLAPGAIRGLINLRGQIVTALDLRCRLGLPPRDAEQPPMNVVLRDGESSVSLLVDRIGDVVEVGDELFEPPPATIGTSARDLIHGCYKLESRLLLALDTKRVVELTAA
ncbi:MAG: chemotaxis protein CheW [Planctomycetes bacterium]|nr:chemotaxis protein CheW [Planctomycetota bacterium]